MLPEDGTNVHKYVMNIDKGHLILQIVYDTVKLEVPVLSQQLGMAGINFPKICPMKIHFFSRNAFIS